MRSFLVSLVMVAAAGIIVDRTEAVTVVKSSAQAWLWVAQDQQQQLVDELRQYAKREGLQFTTREIPAPWPMTETVLKTPQANEIAVANATASDKFSASITVFHREENWQEYWKSFRAHMSKRYRWEDVP